MDTSNFKHNPVSEEVVSVLLQKTQNTDPQFFRLLTAFYISMMASTMRAEIQTKDRGRVPISTYILNLATSGYGKGHSTNIMQKELLQTFEDNFKNVTWPEIATRNLSRIIVERAIRDGITEEESEVKVEKEWKSLGTYVPIFDSGTGPAIKQQRHLLLMSGCGALNFKMDEVGTNLGSNLEVMAVFLELYDVGEVGEKIIKNSTENARVETITGRTPANMLLFGTPIKLLDGGKTEEEFRVMLETGYARRCFFGLSNKHMSVVKTADEIYDELTDNTTSSTVVRLSMMFGQLADAHNFGKVLTISKQDSIFLIEYRQYCEQRASQLPAHQEVEIAELEHRYFKVLKLAGAYAYVESKPVIERAHLESAILMAEESGESFKQILNRDKAHIRLAKYLAECDGPVTQADLQEALPFYKGTLQAKQDMLTLAASYGYTNGITIRTNKEAGVEFIEGLSLEATDLNQIILSYSADITEGYQNVSGKFEDLHQLCSAEGMHWVNHRLAAKSGDSASLASSDPSVPVGDEDVL